MNKEPIPGFDVVTIIGVRKTKDLVIGSKTTGHQAYLDLDVEVPNGPGLLVFSDKRQLTIGPAIKDKNGTVVHNNAPTTTLHAYWVLAELDLPPEGLLGLTCHFYSWDLPPELR